MPLATQKSLLLLIFVIIIILITLSYFTKDGFEDHSSFVENRAKHFANIGLGLKVAKNDGTLGSTANPILSTLGVPGNFPLATGPTDLALAIKKCEAVKTTDCSAFDDPAFTQDCGVCLEIGQNSDKVPTKGGLVVLSSDKKAARQGVTEGTIPSYYPTLGSCPADRLVTTKAECQKLQRELQCEKNSSYDLPGCSQCYSNTNYSIVDPKTSPGVIAGSGKLDVYGIGTLSFDEYGYYAKKGISLSETTPYSINIRGKESTRIKLTVTPPANSDPDNPTIPYISGLISGPTQSGRFDLDLRRIVLNDEVTGRKPRSEGNKTVKGATTTKMAPGFGQDKMVLSVIVPFSFVDPSSQESTMCKDAPFVTTQAGAEFLASDPCYKKGSGPGKFSLECLQGAWITNGCSEDGKGYPGSASSASDLMANSDGSLRTLNEISDFIYNMALITSTGSDENGKKQSIENWSKASVFCTGREVTSPCDTPVKNSGPLSPDCITYLWNNEGAKPLSGGHTNPTGSTYNGNAHSLFEKGEAKRFCQSSGTLAPSKSKENIKYWQKFGGVSAVKREMNNLYSAANAQLQADDKLAPYFRQCYGEIELAKAPACSTALLPISYIPKQNTVLASNLQMTQDFILSMDITPNGTVGSYASIIHFTTGPDCCDLGQRAPGLWFAPGTIDTFALHIGHSNDGGWACRPSGMPFAVGKTSNLKIECRGQNITVTVDDKVYKYTHDGYRYSGKIKTIYGSDPWYPPANCSVENVCLQTLGNSIETFSCATSLLPRSYTPTQGDATVKNLTMAQDYKLEFDITPSAIVTDTRSGGWGSIIHFTANNADWGMLGSRTPAIWFVPGSLNLHVRIGDSTDHNWGFDSQPGCAIGLKTHVSLECKGSNIILKVGPNTFTAKQPTYRYSGPVTVYASDPWYPPAKAVVENLCLVTYGNSTSVGPAWIEKLKAGGWAKMDGGLSNITISDEGVIFGVNAADYIYRRDSISSPWRQLAGGLVQISAGHSNQLTGANRGTNIYRGDGNGGWTNIPGGAHWTAASHQGDTWVIGTNILGGGGYGFWRKDGSNSPNWSAVPGAAVMISVGDDNIWCVNRQGYPYKYVGGGAVWQTMPMPEERALQSVAVSPNGKRIVGVQQGTNALFAWNGSGWTKLAGNLSQVAICDTMIVGIDTGYGIWYLPLPSN